MSEMIERADDFPSIRVYIETTGNLELANVGRFLQRLDTGTRKVAKEHGWRRPSIEIASLVTGSLDLKIKVAGLRVAQGSFAVSVAALALGVAQDLKEEPSANKSMHALLNADRATTIIVEGGGSATIINAEDLPPEEYSVARSLGAPSKEPIPIYHLTGPQSGIIHRYGGETFVELDARPGLFIRVRDGRSDKTELLEDSLRYTFDGEAHVPGTGSSFYLLRKAIRLS